MKRIRFDDIAELKPGDVFYENVFNKYLKMVVETPLKLSTSAEGEETITFIAKDENKHSVDYFINKSFQHYGPQMYLESVSDWVVT